MSKTTPLDLLETICAIDSRTADGCTGTARVAEVLAERLAAMGFELRWVDPPPEEGPRGRHLEAVRHPEAATHLLLMGHVDTVLGPGEAPYRLDAPAGRVHGAGVCDMKGGCVVMLEAIRAALEASATARAAGMTVLLNCAEEVASPSFRALARRSGGRASACLNFEPARPGADGTHQIVGGRKAVVRLELRCTGRGAHAGNDHRRGVSAVRELARKIEQLEALTDEERGLTVNVGHIKGGRASNQVPDAASAVFEVRAFERDVLETCLGEVRAICATPTVRSDADGATARLSLREDEAFPPWSCTGGTEALAQRYGRLAARHGIRTTLIRTGGGSDASHVADLTPTLDGLGVLGGAMHSPEEWADTRSMAARARIAGEMIADLCAHPPRSTAASPGEAVPPHVTAT